MSPRMLCWVCPACDPSRGRMEGRELFLYAPVLNYPYPMGYSSWDEMG
jgi:hypothetical protein